MRIVDANINRASEAARVIEDITRFHLSSAPLAHQAKALRHAVRRAPEEIGASRAQLCEARDSEGDVAASEVRSGRNGLLSVATANFSRLQEAFRVLEEVSHDPSRVFSDLRFRTYSLEKKVVRLLARRKPEVLDGPCVCVIVTRETLAGRDTLNDPLEFIRAVISGGAAMIQLREKSINDKEFLDYASAVHEIASDAGVLLVINDRADVAIAVEADGVHVGQEDLSVKEARRVMGDDRIVGASTHSKEEIERACVAGADYIGFGPVYDTNTKEGVGPAVSPDALGAALSASSVTVYAIGGIGPENVCHVREAGARCVAVCGSAASAGDPAAAIRDMLHDLRK